MGSGTAFRLAPLTTITYTRGDLPYPILIRDLRSPFATPIPTMTANPGPDDVSTEEAFETALQRLIDLAAANGIDPRGSWVYRNGDGAPDWEVQVHELAKQRNQD